MQSTASKVMNELTVHTTIEEQVFYPSVKGRSHELGEMVDEALQEHHVAKMLMDEMKQLEPGGDDWVAKMQVLIENVEHHAGEEEQEMFPKVRAATPGADLESFGARLEEQKRPYGAPTASDNLDLSAEELRRMAAQQKIPGRSKMNKEELAATVAPH
jgi:hemerythrin superfamily protein